MNAFENVRQFCGVKPPFFHLRLPTWASVEAHSAGLNHYFEDDFGRNSYEVTTKHR